MTDTAMISSPVIGPERSGCWLDGGQGWHNNYRIVDIAQEWDWAELDAVGQGVVDRYRAGIAADDDHEMMVGQGGIADQAFDYLDGLTVGCHFERDMGELNLVVCELDSDGECGCES
jgi:hypothetical protein